MRNEKVDYAGWIRPASCGITPDSSATVLAQTTGDISLDLFLVTPDADRTFTLTRIGWRISISPKEFGDLSAFLSVQDAVIVGGWPTELSHRRAGVAGLPSGSAKSRLAPGR